MSKKQPKLLTLTGFERYYPPDATPGEVRYRDSEGRDWYDSRYLFRDDTMKYCYDAKGRLLGFAPSAEFMFPNETISEIPMREWPGPADQNGLWFCDATGVRCRIDNLPERMEAIAPFFDTLAESSEIIALDLKSWRENPNWPYVPFPRFAAHVVNKAVDAGLDLGEYNILSLND